MHSRNYADSYDYIYSLSPFIYILFLKKEKNGKVLLTQGDLYTRFKIATVDNISHLSTLSVFFLVCLSVIIIYILLIHVISLISASHPH